MPKYKVGDKFTHKNASGWIAEITGISEYHYRFHWECVKYIYELGDSVGDTSDNEHFIESVDNSYAYSWTPCKLSLEEFVITKLKEHNYVL